MSSIMLTTCICTNYILQYVLTHFLMHLRHLYFTLLAIISVTISINIRCCTHAHAQRHQHQRPPTRRAWHFARIARQRSMGVHF